MKSTFFGRRSLVLLCAIFFMVPFAMRGARLSLERMENNVKDWLPSTFKETSELEWFAQQFVGQQSFVLLTWEGCTEDDQSYRLFLEKLRREVLPKDEVLPEDAGEFERELARARQLGDELGLFQPADDRQNWGGLNEKWLEGDGGRWYYITPDGELYRWLGGSDVVDFTRRIFRRTVLRKRAPRGELIARFGEPSTADRQNAFYADTRRLTARVLTSVRSGPDIVRELTEPGGPLYPVGIEYAEEDRPYIARQEALDRLEGMLFGPAPYTDYDWTAAGLPRVLTDEKLALLPDDWETRVQEYLDEVIREEYDGQRQNLRAASRDRKERHWDELFSRLEVTPPGPPTCIMVTFSPAGTRDLRRVLGRGLLGKPQGKLIELAAESGILPPPKPSMSPLARTPEIQEGPVLRMGGPPVDNVAIDEEGQITLVRLVGLSIGLGLVLSFLCFRSVSITMMVFFVGGVSAVTSLSIVYWSGSSVDAVLMSMPSLVYVLGLSGAVHIVNYYRDAVDESGRERAPERALSHGWLPCTLAAFTTSLGLLSLYKSNIFPIKKFGLFSAIGVMATLLMLFTFLPAALHLWPPRFARRKAAHGFHVMVAGFWERVGEWVVRRHLLVSGGCVLAMVLIGAGLTKLNTSIQLLKLFDKDAKIIRDYYWLEENIGKLVPMELVVRVDPERILPPSGAPADQMTGDLELRYRLDFLERVELVAHIQRAVEEALGEEGEGTVGRGMSLATISPPIQDPESEYRQIINHKLEANRERYLNDDYLTIDQEDGSELLRISIRLGALDDVDYGEFVDKLKEVVEPVLTAYAYRDQILRQLDEQLGDDAAYWNGGKIFLLGAPDPRTWREEPIDGIDPDRIFQRTLNDLLLTEGFRGLIGGQVPKKFLSWHDPELGPLRNNGEGILDRFHVVVLLEDHEDYDVDLIRSRSPAFVDARSVAAYDPESSATGMERGDDLQVVYTGVVPVVYKAQRTLLVSLIESFAWAFGLIAIVMMVLLRSHKLDLLNLRGGLVSMLPNVFPVVIIFGLMGHLDIAVDIGTMMTASVAMGVAVDDSIHFLTWYRTGLRRGLERPGAIRLAYKHVATAMTQTTLIGGLGLSVFAFSTFTPTQRFGIMMLTLLAAALVGDLVFLPALLASPLGRFFGKTATPPEQERDDRSKGSDGDVAETPVAPGAAGTDAVATESPPAGTQGSTGPPPPHVKERPPGRQQRLDSSHTRDRR